MSVTTEAKGAFDSAKKHWIAFAIAAVVLVAWALSTEMKNAGTDKSLAARMAKWPVIGDLFFKPKTSA